MFSFVVFHAVSNFIAFVPIDSCDMSIIQKCLTNQTAVNEIIIVMTPYCPTPQHLLHMYEGVSLLSLKTFGVSKCSGYLSFLLIYSQTHDSDVG